MTDTKKKKINKKKKTRISVKSICERNSKYIIFQQSATLLVNNLNYQKKINPIPRTPTHFSQQLFTRCADGPAYTRNVKWTNRNLIKYAVGEDKCVCVCIVLNA